LILDFDGVINMLGSGRESRRNPGALGYVTSTELEFDGVMYPVRYSRELVKRLNAVVRETGAEWLWLTTWNECSVSSINPGIGTEGTDWIRWGSRATDAIGSAPLAIEARATAKYAAVVALIKSNPRPFAWVDDEATIKFRAEDFPALGEAQMLVLTPDPRVGVTRPELERLERFQAVHRSGSGAP
jgi:hypothetical protein